MTRSRAERRKFAEDTVREYRLKIVEEAIKEYWNIPYWNPFAKEVYKIIDRHLSEKPQIAALIRQGGRLAVAELSYKFRLEKEKANK